VHHLITVAKEMQQFVLHIVELHVTVNNSKLSTTTDMQQLVPFALLFKYKIFNTIHNNIHILRSSFTSARYFCPNVTDLDFLNIF